MTGYQPDFISGIHLNLPTLTDAQKTVRAALKNNPKEFELKYTHFSIVINKIRKFAFYVATNIDGTQWKAEIKDRVSFTKEENVPAEYQVGDELYDFLKNGVNNDFDKGHIAKFQDPQWGDTATIKKAADDTMKYANCVPQHHTLNRGAWKSLEDYIIKAFTNEDSTDSGKITVFAGPLLLNTDPFYIDLIAGKPLQIPCHFYKIIVYRNRANKLSTVAFIMSQEKILRKYNFVVDHKQDIKGFTVTKETAEVDFFQDFKTGDPYQVRVDFIEQVTGFKFNLEKLYHPYTKKESTEVIYKRVEVPAGKEVLGNLTVKETPLSFTFDKISL